MTLEGPGKLHQPWLRAQRPHEHKNPATHDPPCTGPFNQNVGSC